PRLALAHLQPLRRLRDERDKLSRRDRRHLPPGRVAQVLRILLLHARGPGGLGREAPLDRLQGPPRRGPEREALHADGACETQGPRRAPRDQEDDRGMTIVPLCPSPPPRGPRRGWGPCRARP